MSSPTAELMGEVGLAMPVSALAAKTWDTIVVGAGHNGLACATYLARAGQRVLVIESRTRVGGACTIEEPFPGVRMSPCAYLAGLLHPLVVEELELERRGFAWTPAVNGLFVPFLDRTSIQLWDDDDKCAAEVRALAPRDVEGWRAMCDVIQRLRDKLRPAPDKTRNGAGAYTGDLWVGEAPARDQLEDRLAGDTEARAVLFDWSMAEFVEKLHRRRAIADCLSGPGSDWDQRKPLRRRDSFDTIPSCEWAAGWLPGMWGYVRGGMGMVSFYFCDAAREAGATVISGVPVAEILPGEGVRLEGGERIAAHNVVSNADPRQTLRLLGAKADAAWQSTSGTSANRRLHGEAERSPARAAQLCRASGRQSTPPLWPDQRSAD